MCVFYAAIPTAMALGVTARSRQAQARKEAEAHGKQASRPIVPAGPAMVIVVALLGTASVLIHTRSPGFIG